MKTKTFLISSVLLGGLLAGAGLGCQDSSQEPEPRGLQISVAPLSLPGIVQATYVLTVKNGLGQVVWTQGPLSSTQYGDGRGALTYIGPCDATENPHSVELLLTSLSSASGPLSHPDDFVNPTLDPSGNPRPLIRTGIECKANADVLVQFDLTILRSANQGFFDIAVEFEDVFCSAKLDCRPELLHDGDGVRGPTVVFGFACTGGDRDPTHLYLSDLKLDCTKDGELPITVSLPVNSADPGQQGAVPPAIFQWAVYQGQEFIQSSYDKCYWNMAVGLQLGSLEGYSCTVSAVGTASQSPLPSNVAGEFELPTTGAYPIIRWEVEVLSADGTLCVNNGLNEPGSGVVTDYIRDETDLALLKPIRGAMNCGGPELAGCALDTSFGPIAATPTQDGFVLTAPNAVSAPVGPNAFLLPTGYHLAGNCCAPACCSTK